MLMMPFAGCALLTASCDTGALMLMMLAASGSGPRALAGWLMLMMLFAGCALPAGSCNTGAADAHDARGSLSTLFAGFA